MSETQWTRADRAASALQAYVQEAGPARGYGDEGSEEFDDAVIGLLVDLKHLLWRVGGAAYVLEDLVQQAIDTWSVECELMPEGSGDDD